jgi:hypothetical protein
MQAACIGDDTTVVAEAETDPSGATCLRQPLRFTTEAIENIGAGWRAREIYPVIGLDEFGEGFELAPPGGEFRLYSQSHLSRKFSAVSESMSQTSEL